MNGKKVFAEAIKQMAAILKRACAEAGIQPTDLNLVVPHQANARIVEAVRQRAGISIDRMVNDIGDTGNTSSTTIPLCLANLLGNQPAAKQNRPVRIRRRFHDGRRHFGVAGGRFPWVNPHVKECESWRSVREQCNERKRAGCPPKWQRLACRG